MQGPPFFRMLLCGLPAGLFTDQCQTHKDEEGASTGSKIERPVNVVVVIDQSEQIGTQGLAHSHDHPIYREKSCSVLRFGISCQHIQNACDVDPLRNSKQRSEEHTSELQSRGQLVCHLLLETKN